MTLKLTLPDGRIAQCEGTEWKSTDARLATYCTVATATEAASYLPHPFLESAKRLAEQLGAEFEIIGALPASKPGEIH